MNYLAFAAEVDRQLLLLKEQYNHISIFSLCYAMGYSTTDFANHLKNCGFQVYHLGNPEKEYVCNPFRDKLTFSEYQCITFSESENDIGKWKYTG